MDKAGWKAEIEGQIQIDSNYISSFQTTILILAEILEERDRVYKEYQSTGAHPVIDFTTDRKSVNPKPNPLLKQWQDLNTLALAYLRDLGLTAAGLRKLQGQLPKVERKRSFAEEFEHRLASFEEDDTDRPKTERQIRNETAKKMGMTPMEYDKWYQDQYSKKGFSKMPDDSIYSDGSEDLS